MSVVEEHCFGCSKKRPCKAIDTYKYQGEVYNIYVCQWCRAEITKLKKRSSYLNFEFTDKDSENIKQDFLDSYCYYCGCKAIYLFQDGGCKSCTRVQPEEVSGELL